MGGVCRVTEDVNLLITGIVKEFERIVGVVAIDNQQASAPIRFSSGIFIEVF